MGWINPSRLYWNILEKQLSQATLARLFPRPKFQMISTESNMMVRKLSSAYLNQKQLFTGVYSHLQKNAYSWVSF